MHETLVSALNHLREFKVVDWLSLIFGIVGLVGTVYGYLAWKDAARQKKVYEHLFEIAEMNIDRSTTEAQLAEQRKQVADASSRIESLQQKIRLEIPRAAKRAVLGDRLRNQVEVLQQNYQSVLSLRAELATQGAVEDIPADLLRAIEKEIEPAYLERERISRLKTVLSMLTAGAAISSQALPYPIGQLITTVLLTFAAPTVVALARLIVRNRAKSDPESTRKWIAWIELVLGTGALLLSAGALFLAAEKQASAKITFPIGVILFAIGGFLVFHGGRALKRRGSPPPVVGGASNPS